MSPAARRGGGAGRRSRLRLGGSSGVVRPATSVLCRVTGGTLEESVFRRVFDTSDTAAAAVNFTTTKEAVMAKKSASVSHSFTPNPNPKLGDFLRAPGLSAKPPIAASKSTGPLPRNTPRKGAKR